MKNNQSGFTLIEIVMVLVLLGVLAAVAAPKYFDLKEQAEKSAALATVSEVQARYNALFATQLLAGDKCSAAATTAQANLATETFGDWTATFTAVTTTGAFTDEKAALTITAPSGASWTGDASGDATVKKMFLQLGSCGA